MGPRQGPRPSSRSHPQTSAPDVVDELRDTVRVGGGLPQPQRAFRAIVTTERFHTRTEQHREHQQVVPIDQMRALTECFLRTLRLASGQLPHALYTNVGVDWFSSVPLPS